MFDLGPHASFIVAAYGVTVVAVGALLIATLEDDRKQRRLLTDLERKGIRRRSAAKPPVKQVAPPVKTTAAKPQATRMPAKRKPAKRKPAKSAATKSRARKSPS